MFAAAPPLIGLLIRYWLVGEALKFATGTSKTDLAKAALDVSEQIGNIYTSRIQAEMARPAGTPPQQLGLVQELLTVGAGAVGAPGTIAEGLGYTFEGEFARQQQRLASEVRGGFPTAQARIKGAPAFAKRKVSAWNKQVKEGMKVAKANPKLWRPGSTGLYGKGKKNGIMGQITADLSKLNKGKKPVTKKQKKLKAKLKGSISRAFAGWKKRQRIR